MSLTGTHDVFASAHESALNDLIRAVVRTRPHLLTYGSPAFVPTPTVQESQMPTINFPGREGSSGGSSSGSRCSTSMTRTSRWRHR